MYLQIWGMDAVVAVARKRHQYIWRRRKSGITDHLGSFSPSSNSRKNMISVTVDGSSEAKSASNTPPTPMRSCRKISRAIWIKRKAAPEGDANFTAGGSDLSELWAGPAYAISPPPSSLPTPNFSLARREAQFQLCSSSTSVEISSS